MPAKARPRRANAPKKAVTKTVRKRAYSPSLGARVSGAAKKIGVKASLNGAVNTGLNQNNELKKILRGGSK